MARKSERRLLAIRILDGNLAVPEEEHIATHGLDFAAIGARGRKHPLRHASVAGNEVLRIAPLRVGHRLEEASDCDPQSVPATDAAALSVWPRTHEHDGVRGHHRDDGVHVVRIPGRCKLVEELDGDRISHVDRLREEGRRVEQFGRAVQRGAHELRKGSTRKLRLTWFRDFDGRVNCRRALLSHRGGVCGRGWGCAGGNFLEECRRSPLLGADACRTRDVPPGRATTNHMC
jgi:hypothetical protein